MEEENETAQWKIERIIIDNLPDAYKYAKLEEIAKNSILIENQLRLPIFGKQCKFHQRHSKLTSEASKFLGSETAENIEELGLVPQMSNSNIHNCEKYVENINEEIRKKAQSIPLEIPRVELGKMSVSPHIDKKSEVSSQNPEKVEENKEGGEICEKILNAINENLTDKNNEENNSPSPIKKSKQEHMRLVSKIKHHLKEEWQKPFNKYNVLNSLVPQEMPSGKEISSKASKLWNKIATFSKKDPVPIKPIPLSNNLIQKTITPIENYLEKETFGELANQIKQRKKTVGKTTIENDKNIENNASKLSPQNFVIDDMVEKLKNYEHLFTKEDLKKLAELEVDLESPLDFGLFLADLKNKFNEKYKSQYLNSIGVNLPYKSRRHEMGGAIENDAWPAFFGKLEKIADRVKRKRKRIIANRKKRGKTVMPRKYIYRPSRRPDVRIFFK